MGYIKHNSMIITVSAAQNGQLDLVYSKARKLFGNLVSEIILSPVNGYKTFFIASSGSKYGWDEYKQHEKCRQELAEFIDSMRFDVDNCQ